MSCMAYSLSLDQESSRRRREKKATTHAAPAIRYAVLY
jgi:hypothetical protein